MKFPNVPVKPLGEYLADCVNEAVTGLSTDEKELVDVITQVTPQELKALKEAWEIKYHDPIEKAISGDTSHNFGKTLLNALNVAI